MAIDPLSQIHSALWDTLEASEDFCELVKSGNRIKMPVAWRSPEKERLASADLPQVRIVPVALVAGGIVSGIPRTSSSDVITLRWEVQVQTGDQRANELLFPIMWAIWRAMSAWENGFSAVDWEGATQVYTSQVGDAVLGQSDVGLASDIRGWSTIWAGLTELWMQRSAL